MRIPYDWLQEYVHTNKSPREISDSLTLLGLLLDKPIQNENDSKKAVLELEHRMDRADWLSIIGCARDLAAFEHKELIYPKAFTEKGKELPGNEKVVIKVECPDLVYRFNTKVFKNVKVGDSPDWLKNRLETYGIPAINNVVDITNYVMVEYGQPMHAQDIAKMAKREIVIRRAKKGETVKTLLGETVSLDSDAFVLTQNDKPTVIGGIVGGNDTAVDSTTTEIVLDAGNYNQRNVRSTSRRLKIQNETVMRYDKFLHPHLTQVAVERAVYLLKELTGADYYENEDWYPQHWDPKILRLRYDRVGLLSGLDLEVSAVTEILTALEYKLMNTSDEYVDVEIPYFRTDITVEDDIVADILRIYNYKNIPVTPIEAAPPKEITPKIYDFENRLRDIMVSLGCHEHVTDPLVQKNDELSEQVVLQNALSAEKSALRTTLSETLLPVKEIYVKHKITNVGLFEIGLVYSQKGTSGSLDSYTEKRVMELVCNCPDKTPFEISKNVKRVLAGLFHNLGVSATYKKSNQLHAHESWQAAEIFTKNYDAGELLIGNLRYDGFTLFTENLLLAKTQNKRVQYDLQNIITEDVSLVLEIRESFGPIYTFMKNFSEYIRDVLIIEEFTDEKRFGTGKKAVLVRFEFSGEELTSKNVEEIKQKLLAQLESDFAVTVRSV